MTIRQIFIVALITLLAMLIVFVTKFQSGAELVNAVALADRELVARLIEEGHDVNGVGKDDWTPLTVAIENNDSEMALFLLKKGADPNKIVPGGTALDMALRRRREGPTRVLVESGGECSTACDLLKGFNGEKGASVD